MDKTKATKLDRDNINCPVLLMSGARNRTVNASVVRASAKKCKGKNADKVEYVELSNHTHWLLGEPGWENVADKCVVWLAKQIGTLTLTP